jgi:citrate lyase subunit beta / citryl-CoA lyase
VASLRTWLFVPGNQPRMLAKAPTVGADALLLDLEDSVPLAEKPRARGLVGEAISTLFGQAGSPTYVRVNALQTGLCADDVAAVARPGLVGVMLPKADSVELVAEVEALLARAEASGAVEARLEIVPIVETALGLVRAFDIASASPRVSAVAFGAEDFALDLGLVRTREADELSLARQTVAVAARAVGVVAIDMVYPWVDDEPGLIASAEAARRMGYRSKQVVHPRQVPIVNRVLGYSPEEVEWAKRVVAAYAVAEAGGRGAVSLDGHMIDRPVVERARRVLEAGGTGGDG